MYYLCVLAICQPHAVKCEQHPLLNLRSGALIISEASVEAQALNRSESGAESVILLHDC